MWALVRSNITKMVFLMALLVLCRGNAIGYAACCQRVVLQQHVGVNMPECEPYYWEHEYESEESGKAIKSLGLSRRKVLQMGVRHFSEFYIAQYTKREGRVPTYSEGREAAEILFLWVKRRDNLRRLRQLPAKDAALLRRLDTALTQMEYCQIAMQGAQIMGGTGWLARMRGTALHHESLLSSLMDSRRSWRRHDATARSAYEKALHHLEQIARSQAEGALDPEGYKRALAGFRAHLSSFRQLTAAPFPAGVLRSLARYLGAG